MPVVKINKANSKLFNKTLKDNKFIVVYFMEQCGHCVELKPKWNEAVKKNGDKSLIAEIEYQDMKYLDNNELKDIRGFPTIKVFENGKLVEEYSEERTPEKLAKFIKKNASKKLPNKKKGGQGSTDLSSASTPKYSSKINKLNEKLRYFINIYKNHEKKDEIFRIINRAYTVSTRDRKKDLTFVIPQRLQSNISKIIASENDETIKQIYRNISQGFLTRNDIRFINDRLHTINQKIDNFEAFIRHFSHNEILELPEHYYDIYEKVLGVNENIPYVFHKPRDAKQYALYL